MLEFMATSSEDAEQRMRAIGKTGRIEGVGGYEIDADKIMESDEMPPFPDEDAEEIAEVPPEEDNIDDLLDGMNDFVSAMKGLLG